MGSLSSSGGYITLHAKVYEGPFSPVVPVAQHLCTHYLQLKLKSSTMHELIMVCRPSQFSYELYNAFMSLEAHSVPMYL